MNKNPLIGVSIIAVVLLILATLTNVVGYQTVQSLNQNAINSEIDQKELLFQTIVDIANNKEIQGIILKSQINREGFFNPFVKFSVFKTPILTQNHLKHLYSISLMLSKTISKSKIHSMVEQYQLNNQVVQKEITAVIEKDAALKTEIAQLSNSNCNCEGSSGVTTWAFPVICLIAEIIGIIGLFLYLTIGYGNILLEISDILIDTFKCWS